MRIRVEKILLMIVATAACGCAVAQSHADIVTIRDVSLPVRQARDEVCESNPAAMVCLDSVSLSSIGVSVRYDTQSRAVIEQLGDGSRELSVSARSYTRLTPSSCVWGGASFTTGVTRDVKWTDCIDYLRISPYVLGDAVGGDMSSREYTFSGGYSHSFGRWSVGTEAAYRAEIAWRDRDPRVKTVVSNLAVDLGATYAVSPRYALGIDASVDIYRQYCDLDFYNPVNDINTYPLTGLGTYYKRFTGNNNKNSGYQSDGFSAGIQLVSSDGYGLSSSLSLGHNRMEQRLRNYNNLTLAMTDIDNLGFILTYVCRLSPSLRFAPAADVSVDSRKGTENLFGTSSGASYDIIGSRSNYRQTVSSAALTLPLEITSGQSVFTAIPHIVWSNVEARVIDIDRKLDITGITPGLALDCSTVTPRSMLIRGGISFDYTINSAPAAKNNIPAQAASIDIEGLGECVTSNFENIRSDRSRFGFEAQVGKMINRILYSVTLNYTYLDINAGARCHTFGMTLGATF